MLPKIWNMIHPSIPLVFCLIALGSASMWRDAATQSIENYVRMDLGHQGDFEVQIHLLQPDARRSLTTVLSGVFGFLVKSGVVEDFRISCYDFLRRTGQVVLGETLSRWRQHTSREKRDAHTFSETDFNDGSDVSITCASGRKLSNQTSEVSREQSSVHIEHNVVESEEDTNDDKVRKYLDGYIKQHHNSYRRSETTWMFPKLPYYRVYQDTHWVTQQGWLGRHYLAPRSNVNPQNANATDYCLISDLKCQIVVSSYIEQNHTIHGCGETPTMIFAYQILEWELEDNSSLELCRSMKYTADYLMSMKPFNPLFCTVQYMNRFRTKNIKFVMKTVESIFRLEPDGIDVRSMPGRGRIWREEDCKYRMFTADD